MVRGALALALLSVAVDARATSPPPESPSAKVKAKAKTARPAEARPGRPPSATEIEALGHLLGGEDEATAVEAAKKLGAFASRGKVPAAVDVLVEALTVGTWPVVATEVLVALGPHKDPRALPALVLYAGNRGTEVRLAAVKALGAIADERAASTLHERLGDQHADVRAAAAAALAERRDARVVERLFALVAKNDAGAAAPLGLLAPLAMVSRVAELRGTIDDGNLATTLGEFLKRPDANDRLRLDLVRTVAKLPGAEATAALIDYLASVPAGEERPSKQEAELLVEKRSGL
jgi:HEAT repeat protein